MATLELTQKRSPAGSLLAFFGLTFLVSWTCFGAAVALSPGRPASAAMPLGITVLIYLGTFAPSLVALALTWRAERGAGLSALLARLFQWQVHARWYVFAVSFMLLVRLAATITHRAITGAWPPFSAEPWYLMAAATLFSTLIGGQAGEEIGWRGYALPRLSSRFGLGWASLLLGVLWGLWHLPLFFLPGADKDGQAFPVYLLGVTALSVAFAWAYWRTQGSLLLTMLMHAAINNTIITRSTVAPGGSPFTLHASLVSWLNLAFLSLAAGYFLVRMRGDSDLLNDGQR